MSSSSADPPRDDHQRLHRRLVDGDPTAPADFAAAFLQPLTAWLAEHNRTVHRHLVSDAAEDAILAVMRNPASYRPQDSPLEAYLRMSAQGDLRNLLRRETARQERTERLESVEHSDGGGKYLGRDDDPALRLMIEEERAGLPDTVPTAVRATLTDVEARALELMLRGERRTSAFADACGFADRPPAEQSRLAKQIKDRLKKRIEREGGS
jgi:DNA-directed RNA polymerase specialized sigma24 family protein